MLNVEKFNLLNAQLDCESNEKVKSHTTTDLDMQSSEVNTCELEYPPIVKVSFSVYIGFEKV